MYYVEQNETIYLKDRRQKEGFIQKEKDQMSGVKTLRITAVLLHM